MPPELDAQLAATLTAEELEAINAEDSPEEKLIMRAEPEGDAGDDDDDDGEDGQDDSADDTASTEQAADEPVQQIEDDAPSQVDAKPSVFEAELPADYDQRILDLKARDAQLRQQYKDGEIDIDARDEGLAALGEQREALVIQRAKAEIAMEMKQQAVFREVRTSLEAIKAQAKTQGVDYSVEKNAQAFDRYINFLASDPDWADKTITALHAEAHKHVLSRLGKYVQPEPTPKPAKETIADAVAKRKPAVAAAPKTLAHVPGGDGPGDVSGEFADIEALDGLDLEDAIRKMTPAQREKFARS